MSFIADTWNSLGSGSKNLLSGTTIGLATLVPRGLASVVTFLVTFIVTFIIFVILQYIQNKTLNIESSLWKTLPTALLASFATALCVAFVNFVFIGWGIALTIALILFTIILFIVAYRMNLGFEKKYDDGETVSAWGAFSSVFFPLLGVYTLIGIVAGIGQFYMMYKGTRLLGDAIIGTGIADTGLGIATGGTSTIVGSVAGSEGSIFSRLTS